MKILLVQHQGYLNGHGGTEKMCTYLANLWVKQGYEVCIATCDHVIGKAIFPLLQEVTIHNIYNSNIQQIGMLPYINYKGKNIIKWIAGKIKKKYAKVYNRLYLKWRYGKNEEEIYRYNLLQRAKVWNTFLKKEQPSVIISMSLQSVLEMTYQHEVKVPIINSVNGRPDYDYAPPFRKLFQLEEQLLIASYEQLAAVQVLLPSYLNFIPSNFEGLAKVIANPILQIDNDSLVNHLETKSRYKVVHLGTYNTYCKQQELAIQAFADLALENPNWDMEFWGKGEDELKLKQMINSYGLANRIFLKGFTNHPLSVLKEASIFVFPSKFEGFPLALLEAMAIGLPCIGFASCSGVNELIQHEVTGFLVNDVEEMAKHLQILIENPKLRAEFGSLGNQFSKKFQEEIINGKWCELITEVKNQYVS